MGRQTLYRLLHVARGGTNGRKTANRGDGQIALGRPQYSLAQHHSVLGIPDVLFAPDSVQLVAKSFVREWAVDGIIGMLSILVAGVVNQIRPLWAATFPPVASRPAPIGLLSIPPGARCWRPGTGRPPRTAKGCLPQERGGRRPRWQAGLHAVRDPGGHLALRPGLRGEVSRLKAPSRTIHTSMPLPSFRSWLEEHRPPQVPDATTLARIVARSGAAGGVPGGAGKGDRRSRADAGTASEGDGGGGTGRRVEAEWSAPVSGGGVRGISAAPNSP